MSFALDPNLERDTTFICDLPLCGVHLHKNASWLWLILVPRREQMFDLIDLDETDQATLLLEINKTAHALRKFAKPDKLNIASIGNITRQLHVHVIARHIGDAAWPAPVWGQPFNAEYGGRDKEEVIQWMKTELPR